MRPSPISAIVDFDKDGVQHGFLKLPYSRDDSAWGAVMIPIAVVERGKGPTALLSGANHGDAYEGPIAPAGRHFPGLVQTGDTIGRRAR